MNETSGTQNYVYLHIRQHLDFIIKRRGRGEENSDWLSCINCIEGVYKKSILFAPLPNTYQTWAFHFR